MLRKVVFFVIIATMASAVFGSAATIDVKGGTLQVFTYDVEIDTPPIPATIEIETDNLRLASIGSTEDVITAFIGLPPDFNCFDISIPSIRLSLGVVPSDSRGGVVVIDSLFLATENKLMVTFDRYQVIALIPPVAPSTEVYLSISGEVQYQNFAGTVTFMPY